MREGATGLGRKNSGGTRIFPGSLHSRICVLGMMTLQLSVQKSEREDEHLKVQEEKIPVKPAG